MGERPIQEIVTYWLTPSGAAKSYLSSVIRNLALRWDAPVFEPHVTLYVTKAAGENPAEVLRSTLIKGGPIRLSVAGLEHSAKFTKSLYVQFHPHAALQRLSDRMRAASISPREYELNPHLSLIYKTMPSERKAEIANSVNLPFEEVRFDSAWAVISPADITSREDVEAWRVVATQKLA